PLCGAEKPAKKAVSKPDKASHKKNCRFYRHVAEGMGANFNSLLTSSCSHGIEIHARPHSQRPE
ncbi:MAG: hypothetical protein J0L65_16975, partial [Xanthomonadales bacterium]|nr:hypothetical protein [Xanthomonadales bacterium]